MRVVIGGLKGGIGKTTTAAHLAAALAATGDHVAAIDADPQSQSLYDWASLAIERGEELPWQCLPWATDDLSRRIRALAAMQTTGEHIVIDVGGETSRMFRAALTGCANAGDGRTVELLIPCRANMAELRRIPATLDAAREVEQDHDAAVYPRVLLVAVQTSARDADQARAFLADQGLPVMTAQVRLSVQYARAYGHAIGPAELGDYAAVVDELRTPVTP